MMADIMGRKQILLSPLPAPHDLWPLNRRQLSRVLLIDFGSLHILPE